MQSLAGRTILVVDDEPFVRETLRLMLEAMGAKAIEAGDGLSAIELFRTQQFDCVVTNEMMPNLRGHELALRLRALRSEQRIVLVSAFWGRRDADVVVTAWDVLLPTPVRMDELVAAVAGEPLPAPE
jgi:CheY-like chemotaxis protein